MYGNIWIYLFKSSDMKKLITYSILSLLFIYSSSCIGQSLNWQTLNSGTSQHLWGVSAPTSTVCYAAGYGGTILKTSDGGNSWVALSSGTSADLYQVKFTDAFTGYVIGDNGTALKTTNGGSTWSQMPVGTSNALRGITFLDPSTGYICGGVSTALGTVLKTTDAGATWSQLSVGGNGLYGLSFTSYNEGITANYDGEIFRTADGGLTWNYITSGTTGSLQGSFAVDSTTILLAGHNGTIKRSVNSGMTWSNITSGTSDWLNGMDFYNSSNGVIAGGNLGTNTATLLSTNNGGQTWTADYPSGASRLNNIDFYDQNLGFAVGLNGTIIRTSSSFSVSVSTTDAAFGICDGTAALTVVGGIPPYTYTWATGSTLDHADSLCAGTYIAYVFDSNGDADSVIFDINTASLTVSISSINASAFGMCDGAAVASTTGGSGIYSYLWNTGQTTSSITGLCAGSYTVMVTDTTGLTGIDSIVISQPSDTSFVDSTFIITTTVTNVTVFANCDGTAAVTAAGGTPPYSYLWSNGDTASAISGLCSNLYFVTVNDANGQTVSGSAFVSEPLIIINNTPDSIPNDTINAPPIDTCIIDYGVAVDSAFISGYNVIDASNVVITWIIWQNGTSASINVLYEYASTGTIAVTLVLNCSGDFRELQTTILNDAIYISSGTVGVGNSPSDIHSLKIYPNPASERFNITLHAVDAGTVLQVRNMLGQIVYSEPAERTSAQEISITGLSKGMYMVQVISNGKMIANEKLIIK